MRNLLCFSVALGCGAMEQPGSNLSAGAVGGMSVGGEAETSATGDEVSSPPLAPTSVEQGAVVATCAARYPVAEPFDVGSEPVAIDSPPRPAMPVPPGTPSPVRTVAPIEEECAAHGGTNCDVSSFISRLAAICVAQSAAPTTALSPRVGWGAGLGFDSNRRRVEWTVIAGTCCDDVWQFQVDAASGGVELAAHTGPPAQCTALCQSSIPPSPPPAEEAPSPTDPP